MRAGTSWPPAPRTAANVLAVGLLVAVVLTSAGLPLAGLLLRTAVSARSTARPGVDAIVVLGSTLSDDGGVPPLLASRLDRAGALYRAAAAGGRPPLVVASGGLAPGDAVPEASAMAAGLRGRGVPSSRLLLEDRSTTTQENLRRTAELLAGRGRDLRVLVVTSDYHAWRTASLARREGLQVQVAGAATPPALRRAGVLREARLVLGQQDWARAAACLALAAVARLAATRRPGPWGPLRLTTRFATRPDPDEQVTTAWTAAGASPHGRIRTSP